MDLHYKGGNWTSKIVKYTEFKKVVDALWEKAKNNFVTITKSLEFASKVEPNVISEKTTIVDGYVLGSKVSSVDNKPNQVNYMNASDFFIYEHLKVSANTKISHITIGVNNSLNVGDIVSGVAVGFAKYKATIDTHKKTYEIVEYLVTERNNRQKNKRYTVRFVDGDAEFDEI